MLSGWKWLEGRGSNAEWVKVAWGNSTIMKWLDFLFTNTKMAQTISHIFYYNKECWYCMSWIVANSPLTTRNPSPLMRGFPPASSVTWQWYEPSLSGPTFSRTRTLVPVWVSVLTSGSLVLTGLAPLPGLKYQVIDWTGDEGYTPQENAPLVTLLIDRTVMFSGWITNSGAGDVPDDDQVERIFIRRL